MITAVAGVRHTHFDQYMARWRKAADLPAVHRHIVGQVVAAQGHAPERRSHDVLHVSGGNHLVIFDSGNRRCFVDFLLADARSVHLGFVGQVHEVVDHQSVVALDIKQTTAVGPVVADSPIQVGDQGRIRLCLITRPDPDTNPYRSTKAKVLLHGKPRTR